MKKIGFIGIGVMGQSIVGHLMQAGYELSIYNRTQAKAQTLIHAGAAWYDTPKKVADHCDIIFSMVGYPTDVEEIYYGKDGIFKSDIKNKILVDMTTSTPNLAKKIADTAEKLGAFSLDAPVSGGDLGAQKGTLTVMVGGKEAVFKQMLPIIEIFSSKVVWQGEAGAGQHTKMANQIMIAGTMTGMTELLVYADKAGLDLKKVLETVGGGSAANWSLQNYGPRILNGDYSAGFFVKHFIKDLKIALDEAARLKLDLPCTQLALKLYDQLAEAGYADNGTQALIKLWWADREAN